MAILISEKVDFREKNIVSDKEGHLTMKSVHQEGRTILNTQTLNNKDLKHIKSALYFTMKYCEKMREAKNYRSERKEVNSELQLKRFSILLLIINRTIGQKINIDIIKTGTTLSTDLT